MKIKNYGFKTYGKNVTLSCDSRVTGLNNNEIFVGSSGCGKSSLVSNNILNNEGSMVVSDTKGLLYKLTKKQLRKKGYEVKLLDFVHPTRSTIGFDPLMTISYDKSTGKYSEMDILSLAKALLPLSNPNDKFWNSEARSVLACAISYVLEFFDYDDRNFANVIRVYRKMIACTEHNTEDNQHRISFLEDLKLLPTPSFAYSRYEYFKPTIYSEKTIGCVYAFVSEALEKFDTQDMLNLFGSKQRLDIEKIGKKKIALFVNISDCDRTTDMLASLFYNRLFKGLVQSADDNTDGRLKMPVHVYLDDFAGGVVIEDFDKLISTIRSRDLSVTIALQSLTQLETIYTPAQSATILANCDNILYMGGGNDPRTVDFLAGRSCFTPERILALPLNKALLITRGEPARSIEKLPHYAHLEQPKSEPEALMI